LSIEDYFALDIAIFAAKKNTSRKPLLIFHPKVIFTKKRHNLCCK